MILEWDVLFYLQPSVNPAGGTTAILPALPINAMAQANSHDLGVFQLDPSKCQAGAARRITRNNIAQADGEITHRKFKSGFVIELNMILFERVGSGALPACAGVLREMGDLLSEYLEAIANADGQLIWFPSTWAHDVAPPNPRMMDQARSMGPSGNDTSGSGFVSAVVAKDSESPQTDVTFALLSPLPYFTDFMNYPSTPDATVSWASGAQSIDNIGNTTYYPVIRIHGPAGGPGTDGFTLINYSSVDDTGSPLQIVYDDTLPGAFAITAGDYIEIDTFTNTVRLITGGGSDNAKACIDAFQTDYFGLVPGVNDLFLLWGSNPGTGIDVIYRNAWI